MTWTTSARTARLAARTRFVLLALVSLFLGHDAVYAAEHGIGAGFDSAMTDLGHGAYWGPFTVLAAAAAISLAVGSCLALARLRRRLAGTASSVPSGPFSAAPGGYRHEFAAIWPRLALVVVVLFALQENVEAFLAHGVVPGVDVLFAGELPLADPGPRARHACAWQLSGRSFAGGSPSSRRDCSAAALRRADGAARLAARARVGRDPCRRPPSLDSRPTRRRPCSSREPPSTASRDGLSRRSAAGRTRPASEAHMVLDIESPAPALRPGRSLH